MPLVAPKPPFLAFTKPKEGVALVTLSPDGTRLFARVEAPRSTLLRVHAWPSLEVLAEGKFLGMTRVALSSDGTRLAFPSGTDKEAQRWEGDHVVVVDAATAKVVAEMKPTEHPATSVGFSPDGKQVAVGEYEGFRIYDAATGKQARFVFTGTRVINSVAWSPDGTVLVTRAYGDVGVWDAKTMKQLGALEIGDYNADGPVVFFPDGSLVTVAAEKTLGVWAKGKWNKPAYTATTDYTASLLAVAGDTGLVVSAGRDHGVRTWDRKLQPVEVLEECGSDKSSVAITRDGRTLIVVAGKVLVWTDGVALTSVKDPRVAPVFSPIIASPRKVAISSVAELEAFVAKTKWLSQVGKPTKAAVKRLDSLAKWTGAEQARLEPIFTLPVTLLDEAEAVAKSTRPAALKDAAKLSGRVNAAAKKALHTRADGDVTQDPATAAVYGAASTVEAAAAWLGLGWALPSDLQTLLAWYGEGRWPCGVATAPREGRATAILIC
jgi:WD40 repeat protein